MATPGADGGCCPGIGQAAKVVDKPLILLYDLALFVNQRYS